MRIIFIILFCLLITSTQYAETIIVNANENISAKLSSAQPGDTLFIKNDNKILSKLTINKDITLIGESSEECQLNFQPSNFQVDDFIDVRGTNLLVIKNIKIRQMVTYSRSFINIDSVGQVFMENVDFGQCDYPIIAKNCNINITSCVFTNTYKNCIELESVWGVITNCVLESNSNCLISSLIPENRTLTIDSCFFNKGLSFITLSESPGTYHITNNRFNANDSSTSIIYANQSNCEFSFNTLLWKESTAAITFIETPYVYVHHNRFASLNNCKTVIYTNEVDTLNIINNTFYNFSKPLNMVDTKINFINNILYTENQSSNAIECKQNVFGKMAYNLFWGYEKDVDGILDSIDISEHYFEDPLFYSTTYTDNEFLYLTCNSPCIDLGDPSYSAINEPNTNNPQIIDLGFTGNTAIECLGGSSNYKENRSNEEQNLITIYPNPASDYIICDNTRSDDLIEEVVVYNLLGEIQFKQNTLNKSIKINLNSLCNGIYFIKIKTTREKIYIKRMMVAR